MTQPSTPVTPAADAADAGAKPRILIVDDEPSMREMLRIVLRRDGYDVAVAAMGPRRSITCSATLSTCCCPTFGCPA